MAEESVDIDAVKAALTAAQNGDQSALVSLRQSFEVESRLWKTLDKLTARSENTMIELLVGNNKLLAEKMRLGLAALKRELSGPNPTLLEELLVERIVVCWLDVHYADFVSTTCLKVNGTDKQVAFCQKYQNHAQRRYLAAVKSLALVRRLLTPQVQVNIGARQVNVAQ
ncbi:MAG TPA: hypothetical protein VHS06_04625 [Chloroflexota bacterium]|nr:hypothetical protein [Chloroflexota bacterium]